MTRDPVDQLGESAVMGQGSLEAGMHVMIKPFALDGLATRIRGLISAA